MKLYILQQKVIVNNNYDEVYCLAVFDDETIAEDHLQKLDEHNKQRIISKAPESSKNNLSLFAESHYKSPYLIEIVELNSNVRINEIVKETNYSTGTLS